MLVQVDPQDPIYKNFKDFYLNTFSSPVAVQSVNKGGVICPGVGCCPV